MKKALIWSMVAILVAGFAVIIGVYLCHDDAPGLRADMHKLTDNGFEDKLGIVEFIQTEEGLKGIVQVSGLVPGKHGFHIHTGYSCGPDGPDGKIGRGLAALGHYDPDKTGQHLGPLENGHAGDLPVLTADDNGTVYFKFIVSGLNTHEIVGRAIIIHDAGDNYSDSPEALGGGGGRYACGILEYAY